MIWENTSSYPGSWKANTSSTKVIPNNFETKVVINRQRFLESVERASVVIVTEEKIPSYLQDRRGQYDNTDHHQYRQRRDMLTVEAEGNDIEIRFNPRYFIESLRGHR